MNSRTVIITGGAGGIGLAAAKKFHSMGDTVILWDLNKNALRKAVENFKDSARIHIQALDISKEEAVNEAVESIMQKFGKIDILINNAGITRDASLKNMSVQQWDSVMEVNLKGPFLCTKAVSTHMAQAGKGRIINTASVVAHYGNYGQSNYVASKSGLIGMTKVWARELGKYHITVNAVAPGFIATDMLSTIPEKILNSMLEKSALKRLGTPEDIAEAYYFLASDAAAFITGTTLNVDGGLII